MAADKKGFLDGAYTLGSNEETEALYAKWAATYEAELEENGYATPTRCAGALAEHASDRDAPVIDLGCGTGLSGVALKSAGFTVIDGVDASREMLTHAATKTGVYRSLGEADLSRPFDLPAAHYANACATGVVSPGHAPPDAVRYALDILPVGGCFVLSLNDHALEEGFESGVDAVVEDDTATLVFEEYGEHLPGISLKSIVYVLRKNPR